MYTRWQLLAALLLLLHVCATRQNPTAQNYSSDILRVAKGAQIRAYMNTDKDYCNNFYKYACGKWKRLQAASASKPKTAYLEQLDDLYMRKSAEMLQSGRELDNSVDRMLKDFFESCHNEAEMRHDGLEPILKAVNLRGGWPNIMSYTWYEYEYDWLKLVAELRRKLGVDILIGLDVVPDYEDKDMHRIKVGAPQLQLGSRDAYLSDDFDDEREAYRDAIEQKLRKHFPSMSHRWADEVAHQVLHVEQQLAKGLPDNDKLTLPQTTRQRFASELKAAYGSFVDLNRYLNLIFNQTIYSQVYETPEDYMSNLVEVIKSTPKLTIANYTMWRVLEHLDFAGEINNRDNDNWCVQQVIKYFPEQLESMFHRNYNSMLLLNELQSVFADVRQTFRNELFSSPRLNWISQNTRQKAMQKLDDLKLQIIVHNDAELAEQLHGLSIRLGSYYDNLIRILQWQTQKQLAKLIDKPQPAEPPTKLPIYRHSSNNIEVPITFLQSRFFWDPEYPNALKFATLGFILAHEMLHGFDAVGRRYDQHGIQRGWWDSSSEYAYDERANCFAKHHYGNFEYRGKDVFNAEAHMESILDSGGLAIAYRAYDDWWENLSDKHTLLQKETLPLLDLTPRQLFFVSFAQLWCVDYHESVETFSTMPEPLRVNDALANFKEFSNEMKCPQGSKMNPQKKCVIY